MLSELDDLAANGPNEEEFDQARAVLDRDYALIGNGGMDEGGCGLHNPNYDFNDRILPVGAAFWVSLVETQFPTSR